jgi:N-acetyl-anhydromuramyl-L-alanine amidase AmpD
VDLIVIHGTEGSTEGDRSWIANPAAQVSYHYHIGRDGSVVQFVAESGRAWHAGVSIWKGRPNCNNFSIGIGLACKVSDGHYTDAQYKALGALVRDIRDRRDIRMENIVGHYHVSPGRKTDPWHFFDWARLWEALR